MRNLILLTALSSFVTLNAYATCPTVEDLNESAKKVGGQWIYQVKTEDGMTWQGISNAQDESLKVIKFGYITGRLIKAKQDYIVGMPACIYQTDSQNRQTNNLTVKLSEDQRWQQFEMRRLHNWGKKFNIADTTECANPWDNDVRECTFTPINNSSSKA